MNALTLPIGLNLLVVSIWIISHIYAWPWAMANEFGLIPTIIWLLAANVLAFHFVYYIFVVRLGKRKPYWELIE